MKYTESIKSKLYKYFRDRLDLKPSTNGYIRGHCPYCGGKNTFGINVNEFKVHCFKDCGVPSPIKLIMFLEDFATYNEARDFLSIQQEYELYDKVHARDRKKLEVKPIELPESFTPISMGRGVMANAARHSLSKRGFNINSLALQGVGYCVEGPYAGYIVFPFYYKGKLVFFQGRKFAGGGPKMQNPKEEDFGIGKSQLIYNMDAIYMYNHIYILESITNSITLGDRATGMLGKKASPWQISQYIKSPCKKFTLLLDPDAKKEAIELAMVLIQYKEVKLILWNGDKDVNDLGKKFTLELCKKTPYIHKYGDLTKLKNQLKHEATAFPTY